MYCGKKNALGALILLLLIIPFHISAGNIYKCKVNGRMVYTDKPCDGEIVNLPSSNIADGNATTTTYNSTEWYYNASGYQEALKLSQQYNAPIFIFFEAKWCSYCRKLEKELLHLAEAKTALRPFITVQITPDDGPAEYKLFKSFGGTGYPTIYIQKNNQAEPQKTYLQKKQGKEWRTKSVAEFKRLLAGYLS